MIALTQIKDVTIELTTLCNARCPLCERNANGYPHNFGYPETSLSLDQIKRLFLPAFIKQLNTFTVCGNFGDFVACPDALEIIQYIRESNLGIGITISTNGSARGKKFWSTLASYRPIVTFCIDGLEDTHNMYRVDTNWQQIISNAQTFIAAGGQAIWKMIDFPHNKHQVEQCRQIAVDLGFSMFELADHGRISGPVFDRNGIQVNSLGDHIKKNEDLQTNFIHWAKKSTDFILPAASSSVTCYSEKNQSIYVAANGEIYPCCFLAFYPRTFAKGWTSVFRNQQLNEILNTGSNNALEVGIESAMKWFDQIRQRWGISEYTDGRLQACDEHCGSCNKYNSTIDKLSPKL
jgi:MoaA/NifB/PqqE/SkfB family radical SAM enzyme